MEAVTSEVVALGKSLMDPFSFCVFVSLGLFLTTGAAAHLLTVIQDLGPMRRNS